MNETYKIRNVGGSLMVVLPQRIVRTMELQAGDEVTVQVEQIGYRKRGPIVITPVKPKNGARK
jgi:antitoxin component of MazEF toxin-antitoxin module